ncbi:nitrate reductase subunit alpha [Bacillus kwashiorkori]|uniref:nitrate reductase subunit alpha n=1 Tax=Bacillus kwashiorkori TaxID=1522318 RepID=UPI0007857C64|nr:nitrate reductase subunit alpha [Bacillus kwashiorkori]
MDRKVAPFLKKLKYFGKATDVTNHGVMSPYGREVEKVYRRRWQHDKVVRTTHGVNCTGSCSWRVHVKDGIITWETQALDYPTTGPDMPEFEPRGCQRGATFSWYIYSPVRVRYPYVRAPLLSLWREAIKLKEDPLEAWKSIVENPDKKKRYHQARGKGGFIRASWNEVNTLISASLIYTIQKYGPDRIFGFSPIPAMSMVSYASGARFLNLIGGALISFYDWYADLPPSSPQVWGEQTDVPESSDWFNSSYIIMWGSNIPQTRTPDAHFMVEARYRGTKVVAVAPDYAENVKFADNWLPVSPGMDSALAMAMTHVVLKEFYIDNKTGYFYDYAKKFTDLPFLVTLKKRGNNFMAGRFLRANDIGRQTENAEWKTVILDEKTNQYVVPNGTIGQRWSPNEEGNWNLHLKDSELNLEEISPALTLLGHEDEIVAVDFAHFELENKTVITRAVPVKKITQGKETIYVTTVFDLLVAKVGIGRGLQGDYPDNYDDPKPYTPSWQEAITGIDRNLCAQIAREFAQNAIDSKGRSLIIMGSGINHWFHADSTYRAILNLVLLTGSQGVNGGGWAHYVGQEKVRPIEGWQTVAMARDWGGPPRLQNGTSFFYFLSEQWKYDEQSMADLISPLVEKPKYEHSADYNHLAVRMGWLPSYPTFNENSINLVEQMNGNNNEEVLQKIVDKVKKGELSFAIENPNDPKNTPRILFVWRGNLIGSSAKGHEYFLKHMLGTHHGNLSEQNETLTTKEIKWDEASLEGKLDLLINIDFRMTGTSLYSDILLPAATWYEKYDVSSTDMHPFIHPFNPAIAPPWQSRSDWDFFKKLAKRFSELAKNYFEKPVKDVIAQALLHDSRDELAQPYGISHDWKDGKNEPVPGVNFPRLHIVERDYRKVYDKYISLGPMVKEQIGAKGLGWNAVDEYEVLKKMLGRAETTEEYKDFPSLETDRNAVETILTLSSATNGSMAMKAWGVLEKKTGQTLKDLAQDRAEEHMTVDEITAQPRQVISTPMFSGTETGNRRYSPFTTNIERLIPFRTLTGRQHFYLDHDLMIEFGDELPTFRAPLKKAAFISQDKRPEVKGKEIILRYLTPHYKWSYHSTYYEVLQMLTLFRGGPHIWLSVEDAEQAGINDNDWLEIFNRNGVVVARAVVSHRMPKGVTYMYHVQDRFINVPGSPITKLRGGTFNSPNRVHMKPTHMIGGYAQLSYGFNYYGPCGTNRDEKVVIRKLENQEVDWLES